MTLKNKCIVSLIILNGLINLGGTSDRNTNSTKIELSDVYQAKLTELETPKLSDSIIKTKSGLIESTFLRLRRSRSFNGCVLVSKNGQVLYKGSFGVSDNTGKKLTDSSVFQLASVSKTITGVSVMILLEKDLLGIDDFVVHYLPEFPYRTVTIKDLLTHRSGIPDYTKLSNKWYPNKRYLSNLDAYHALIRSKKRPDFYPGIRFDYNNSNYAILALIVEKITGESFPEFVRKNIFDPLDMRNSFIASPDLAKLNKNLTTSHHPNNRFDGVFGDKGAYSTVEDMFKLDRALQPGVILKPETLKLAFTNSIRGSRSKGYGFGFRLKTRSDGETIIFHNGWWHGYRTAFHRRELDNSCVIILSNRLDAIVYSKPNDIFKILDN